MSISKKKMAEMIDTLRKDVDEVRLLLNLTEPENSNLKKLTQSVFDGLDSDYMFAAIDGCTGRAYAYEQKPHIPVGKDYWRINDGMQNPIAYDYDTSNWQDSLIERDKVELTGSDLCRKMLERGDKHIMCFIGDLSDSAAIKRGLVRIVTGIYKGRFETNNTAWSVAIPINSQDEPLTQSDVGL